MKILHIINSLATGGAEKLLLESIPIYNEKGIISDLLVLNGTKQPFLEELEKTNCCSIYKLGSGSVYNPFLIFRIIPFLKKYDVVHVHLFPSLYWVALAKLISFSNVKLIYTEHSTSNKRRNNLFFKTLDAFIYSKYTKIVSITQQVDFNLKSHLDFKSNKPFEIIQNGLNLNKIKEAKAYDKSDFFEDIHSKIIIQVARFYEPKDHKTVIKAIALLPKELKLILVGDGILKTELEQLVKALDLQNRILFLGVRKDVLQLLKTADVIVLSSKHEGLSLSCIEGLASGKPFIASNVEGLKEVVKGAGILFELENEKDLAEKIIQLLENENYYNEIVLKCQLKANEFDIDKMTESYLLLYKNCIK